MNESAPVIDWTNFAGPVARAYEESRVPVGVIEGPTAGGKSQASARKIMRVALNQHPSPRDGVRKARITVVTPTYRRAHDTVIPSYLKVWPKEWGKWSGGIGDPCDHVMDFALPRPGKEKPALVHIEVKFRATRDESLEEFVRGNETTAWWDPEMDTMPAEDLLSLQVNRVGRYPEPDDRPDPGLYPEPSYAGVFGDANAPVIGSWFHRDFYLNPKPGYRLYRQPNAFHPKAENMHNLRKIRADYYAWLASTMADYDVGRLLRCQPGWSRNGKPVYEHYDDRAMVASGPLEGDPNLLLEIGADVGSGLTPAATFGQRDFGGTQRCLAEIAPRDRQMDLAELGREIRRVKDTRFAQCNQAIIHADPASIAKSAHNRLLSFAAILQAESGIEVQLAPSNDPKVRIAAVNQAMQRRGGLVIDPRCEGLRAAYAGGYRFKKVGNVYSPSPEKNEHSHVADADQYRILGSEGLGAAGGGFISPQGSGPETYPMAILAD